MSECKCLFLLLISTSLFSVCTSDERIMSILHRLGQFEEELLDNKADMLRTEQKILALADIAKTSLRAEVKQNIRDEVRNALAEILGESHQGMLRRHVVTELRSLKQGYHQMKRQMHHVSKSLNDMQDRMVVFQESIEKTEVWNGEKSGDVVERDKQGLVNELRRCETFAADLKADHEHLLEVNETCQSQISKLKEVLASTSPKVHETSVTPLSTTLIPTPGPEKKRRILIAPLWSDAKNQFRQLHIHSNTIGVYRYLHMTHIASMVYAEKARKLLIGTYRPQRIFSSALDTSQGTMLKEGVRTFGMAVDEERDIVFMTTEFPRYTVSRMTTGGRNFDSVIDISKYGSWPNGITLDTRRKRIYACNDGKMFTVTYDGQGLSTLATGSHMFSVTVDQTAGVVYYNNEKKLMKMTVSNNVSTAVTSLDVIPWNMRLYRGAIYYSSYGDYWINTGTVGFVNVTYNIAQYRMQSISMKAASSLLMCLIP
ncbi:uncharacterized protein [Haliotis asinina]|uniref:uncharacterized protein n=1 Tax=Haliotis asinina TaxID=109174 RepID=UPI0035321672